MNSRKLNTITKTEVTVLILMLIIFGAANTIILKIQNVQIVENQSKFFHPYIQCCGMFLGQALCIFVFLIKVEIEKKNTQNIYLDGAKQAQPTIIQFAIPAILDFLASNLSYISLNLISSSVWQISKGGVIITTAFFTKILLKKNFNKSSYLGCAFAFIGITIVELASIFLSNKSTKTQSTLQIIIGIMLVIASLLFTGLQFCYEQNLFANYNLDPFKLVGYEGMVGLVINIIFVFILEFIKCPWQAKSCGGQSHIQSYSIYFHQLNQNKLLLAMCILQVFTIAISVSIAVTITKKINAISRSIADVTRTVLIWGIGLIITKTIGQKSQNYKFQNLNGTQIGIEAAGFFILIIGTLIYHDIIKINKKNKKQQQQDLIKSGVFQKDFSLQRYNTNQITRQSLT